MAPGWHTYWEYPGDAGLPPRLPGHFPRDSSPDRSNGLCRTVCSSRATSKSTPTRIRSSPDGNCRPCEDSGDDGDTSRQGRLAGLRGDLHSRIGEPGIVSSRGRSVRTSKRGALRRIPRDPSRSHSASYSLKWTKSGTSLDLKVSGLDDAKAVDLYPLPPKGEQVGSSKERTHSRRKINDCTWRVRRVSGRLGRRNRRRPQRLAGLLE